MRQLLVYIYALGTQVDPLGIIIVLHYCHINRCGYAYSLANLRFSVALSTDAMVLTIVRRFRLDALAFLCVICGYLRVILRGGLRADYFTLSTQEKCTV